MCYVWVVTHPFPTEMSNTERQDYIYTGTVGYLNRNLILKGEGTLLSKKLKILFSFLYSNKKESVPVSVPVRMIIN